jgi:hypothetical protein
VRVRVLGQPQNVELEVRLAGRVGYIEQFYRDQGAFSRHGTGVIRRIRGGEALEVGTHVLEWDGRDGTGAKRIALEGHYRIVVDSGQRRGNAELGRRVTPAPERRVKVARPRAILVGPGAHGPLANLGIHYRCHDGVATGDELLGDLTRCAAAFIDARGAPNRIEVGSAPLDLAAVGGLHEREGTLPGFGRGPLADVHVVHVIAGAVDAPCLQGGGAWQEEPIAHALIAAGVDVVVVLDQPIIDAESGVYHEELGPRLIEFGMPLKQALEDARNESYERVWEGRDLGRAAAWTSAIASWLARRAGKAPIRDAMKIHTASKIDLGTERLMPARHGDSTN